MLQPLVIAAELMPSLHGNVVPRLSRLVCSRSAHVWPQLPCAIRTARHTDTERTVIEVPKQCFTTTGTYYSGSSNSHVNVFDRKTKRMQKDYYSAVITEDADVHDHIKNEVAFNISDRIGDVCKDFHLMFDMGCGRGHVAKNLTREDGIQMVVQVDLSYNSLLNSPQAEIPTSSIQLDEEFNMPFKENVFDLVTSSLSVHWVNDIPGCLKQVLKILRPDGCFLGAAFGGDTLFELRCSLQLAEMEREGGMAPHVSPLLQGHGLTNLLTRAGFDLVTVDVDQIVVYYPSMFELVDDLRFMGEGNSLHKRRPLKRDTLVAAASVYEAMYAGEDGSVPATFQIIYFIGWKPERRVPKP